MKTFAEFSEELQEAVEIQQELGENIIDGAKNLIRKGTDALGITKPQKKSFMQSISRDNRPAQRTTRKAPEFNLNKNIKYSERDADTKTKASRHDGVI